jgi:hypothetical protein
LQLVRIVWIKRGLQTKLLQPRALQQQQEAEEEEQQQQQQQEEEQQEISGITAPLHTPIANTLGQRELTGGCTAKDIQVTEVFVLRYERMGALK